MMVYFLLATTMDVCWGGDLSSHALRTREEISSFLELAGTAMLSNYQRIRSWQGTYALSEEEHFMGERARQFGEVVGIDRSMCPDTLHKKASGKVRFVTEVDTNRLYVDYEVPDIGLSSSQEGGKLPELLKYHQRSVTTPEHYLHFQPNARWGRSKTLVSEGGVGRAAFRDPLGEADGQKWGILPDPRSFFAYARPFWEEMQTIVKAMEDSGAIPEIDGLKLEVTYDAEPHRYRVSLPGKIPGGLYLFVEYVIDVNMGYNVTSVVARDSTGRVHQDTKIEYVEKEGIFLPKLVTYKTVGEDGQHISFVRRMELTETTLNQDIDPAVFSPENLGLEEGDRYIDNIKGTESVYEGGRLRPARVPEANMKELLQLETVPVPSEPESDKTVTEAPVSSPPRLSEDREKKGGGRMIIVPTVAILVLTLGVAWRVATVKRASHRKG